MVEKPRIADDSQACSSSAELREQWGVGGGRGGGGEEGGEGGLRQR